MPWCFGVQSETAIQQFWGINQRSFPILNTAWNTYPSNWVFLPLESSKSYLPDHHPISMYVIEEQITDANKHLFLGEKKVHKQIKDIFKKISGNRI